VSLVLKEKELLLQPEGLTTGEYEIRSLDVGMYRKKCKEVTEKEDGD